MSALVRRQLLQPYIRYCKVAPIGCGASRQTFTTTSLSRSSLIRVTNPGYRSSIGELAVVDWSKGAHTTCKTVCLTTNRMYSTTTEKQETTPAKQSRLVQLFQKSKALVVFYKDGLKMLWANHKAAKALKQQMLEGHKLNRSEYQLLHKSKKDMIKLAPFGLIFMVLPESIPLFVMFAPGIIPSTCVTEAQVLKQRKKLDDARQRMSINVIKSSTHVGRITPEDFLSIRKFLKIAKSYEYDFDLSQIHRANLAAYCRFMGLSDWGLKSMVEKRLNKHLDYLLEDDKLISQEGVNSLNVADLQQAVEERGMRSIDVSEEQLRRSLDYWITVHLNEQHIPRGLLIFSRMFLLNANYK